MIDSVKMLEGHERAEWIAARTRGACHAAGFTDEQIDEALRSIGAISQPIPILWQHDPARVVGRVDGDEVIFTAESRVTADMIWHCSWQCLEHEVIDGVRYLRRVRLLTFAVGL